MLILFSFAFYPILSLCGLHTSALQITKPKPAQVLSSDFAELPLSVTLWPEYLSDQHLEDAFPSAQRER